MLQTHENDPNMQAYTMARERIRCPLLDENEDWRRRLLASDTAYRTERRAFDVEGGIAGCRESFKVKCLHAHAADWLVAGLNPIGERVIELAPIPDDCSLCDAL